MPEPLTPAEWKIMKIVWRKKECAARDVYQEAGRQLGWAPTTAKSVLRRLVEKGCLTTTQVGNSFLYRPAESVVKSLTSLHLLDRFDTLVCAEDYKRGKPAPDCFLMAAERLGVAPSDCLVFEDTDLGIEAATAAGMPSVKVPLPFERIP